MHTVTLPSGKVYRYGPSKLAQARALAAKTGGTLRTADQGRGPWWDRDGDDGHDARRDADAERYGSSFRRTFTY